MKKYWIPLLFLCSPAFGQDYSLVTRLKLEAASTPAGYVISGTMFYEIIAELQAAQERLLSKDRDIDIVLQQKKELESALEAERQAKDLLLHERVATVLEQENMLLEGALSPEEKAIIEDTIKSVVAVKAVPIPIYQEPVIVEPIQEEPIIKEPIKEEEIIKVKP